MTKNIDTARITRTAVLAALAIVLGWVERQIPLFMAVPGVKLGLSNVAVLMALYDTSLHSRADAFWIVLIKTMVTGLLFSGVTGFLYAVSGGVVSWGVMCLLKKNPRFSVYGVSIGGAAAHCIGQLACAAVLTMSFSVLAYGALMLLCSIPAGTLIAFPTAKTVGKVKNLRLW